MYKIFVNEKLLTLSTEKIAIDQNINFKSSLDFDTALDMLCNTNNSAVNIYFSDLETLWQNFLSHITQICAAGGIVRNEKNQYLFIKRNGKWDLPKGHIEKGETREIAAVREVEEECSITNLILDKYLTTTHHIYFDKKYILKTTYWYSMEYKGNKIPTPQIEENIEIAEWVSKEKIPKLMQQAFENIRILANNYILY